MSIQSAILGLLNSSPSTGYELKKVFEESSFLYWSGNNNQIYKALISLEKDGFVCSELVHSENSPSKKVYTITPEGKKELRDWLMTPPEAPEIKKTFLVQLACSKDLSDGDLSELLSGYEKEVRIQLMMHEEKTKLGLLPGNLSERELAILNGISENISLSYKTELAWVRDTKKRLLAHTIYVENKKMNYTINEKDKKKYLELHSVAEPLHTEAHALDIISLCWENDIHSVLIHGAALSEDFFRLKTKVAGNMLQKFVNYGLRTAAIVPPEFTDSTRMKELISETNKGDHFRIYENREDAEIWLLSRI